jgi:hypothetical protein
VRISLGDTLPQTQWIVHLYHFSDGIRKRRSLASGFEHFRNVGKIVIRCLFGCRAILLSHILCYEASGHGRWEQDTGLLQKTPPFKLHACDYRKPSSGFESAPTYVVTDRKAKSAM